MTRRSVVLLGAALLLVTLVSLWGLGVSRSASDLFPAEGPDNPFFVPDHALLLYLALPLTVLSWFLTFLAPGIILLLAWGRTERLHDLVLRGFLATFMLDLVVLTLARSGAGMGLGGTAFVLISAGMAAAALVVLAIRVYRGDTLPSPLAEGCDRRRLGWLLVVPLILTVALLPSIYFEDLNEDGCETYESGRALDRSVHPVFASSMNAQIGLGLGMVPAAYATNWFLMLCGPVEAAARLPFVLFATLLLPALWGLAEWGNPRRLRFAEEIAIAAGVAAYVVTITFSSGYDVYSCDVASPGMVDTLAVLLLAGAILSLWSRRTGWFILFVLFAYMERPTGVLLLALLGLGAFLFEPRIRWYQLRALGAAFLICGLFFVLYEKVYLAALAEGTSMGYASSSILGRLRYIRFDDFARILWVAIPCGILPVLAMLRFRAQDAYGRSLTLLVVLYFLFFYVMAFVSLHHFAPVMVLPVAVLARLLLRGSFRPLVVGAAIALALLSVFLSLPPHYRPNRTARTVGRATDYRVGDYDGDLDDYLQAMWRRHVLAEIFPRRLQVEDPSRETVVGSMGVVYYSRRFRDSGAEINYIVQEADEPDPAGFTRAAERDGTAVLVRDPSILERDRTRRIDTDYKCPLYVLPPETQFKHLGVRAKVHDIDLARVPLLGRLFRGR